MVCYDRTIFGWDTTICKSGIWGCKKNLNIEKITFKVVQMKFLAMHITNQKLSFDIFTVGNLQNIFMEHDLNILMIFGIKEKWIILTHTMYCCLLLQIYLCYLWLLLCSRDTNSLNKCLNISQAFHSTNLTLFQSFWSSEVCIIMHKNAFSLDFKLCRYIQMSYTLFTVCEISITWSLF